MFYEYVGNVIATLPLPEFEPINYPIPNEEEYIVMLSDIHYGAVFKSENNEYSPEIAKRRMEVLAARLIDFVQKKSVQKLRIVSGGDTLQGVLRINDLRINDSTVVKSCVEVSRLN